jgi:hypothetical protein
MKSSILVLTVAAAAGVIALGQIDVGADSGPGAAPPPTTGGALGEFSPAGVIGPDVIVGDLPEMIRWATDATETAYSVGTMSCNVGDMNLDWLVVPSNRHPVIGQNMFRLSANGQSFEQIGQAWLKHGFCALQLDLAGCGDCANSPGCLDHLEPGCSDPYDAELNGNQNGLGPKWQVNAHTGEFPIPWAPGEGTAGNFRRRLRVKNADLALAFNPSVKFFVEGHYVAKDDATWGNQNNNASYRRVLVDWITYDLVPSGPAHMMAPGIQAWKDNVPDVTLVDVQLPEDGRFVVGYRVLQLSATEWGYEYAVYNMNADRAAGSFTVPVPADVTVAAVGFHDVDYHSGEAWDSTDWSGVRGATDVSWSTEAFESNPNANALRWGTLYNYRFTASAPPVAGQATLGLFKPGTPTAMTVDVMVPQAPELPCAADVDGSGDVGFPDLLAILSAWDCTTCDAEDINGDGTVGFGDLLIVLSTWGPCA